MHSARRTETVLRYNQLPARSHKSSISRHLRHLTVFQLLIRCVHPRACAIPRTWSTIVQSVTMSSSTGCISACIVVSKSIVDGLISYWQAQRTNCVSKMKSQSQWSANAYKEAHNGLYTPTLKSLRLDIVVPSAGEDENLFWISWCTNHRREAISRFRELLPCIEVEQSYCVLL